MNDTGSDESLVCYEMNDTDTDESLVLNNVIGLNMIHIYHLTIYLACYAKLETSKLVP
jgi:hypothetical protein